MASHPSTHVLVDFLIVATRLAAHIKGRKHRKVVSQVTDIAKQHASLLNSEAMAHLSVLGIQQS